MSKKRPLESGFRAGASAPAPSAEQMLAQLKDPNYGALPVSVAPHHTAPHDATPHRTTPHDTTPHDTLSHRTMPHETLPQQAAPQRTPWADANPKVPVNYNVTLDEVLRAKALFLLARMPGWSQQKLYRAAIEEKIEALLKQYGESEQ